MKEIERNILNYIEINDSFTVIQKLNRTHKVGELPIIWNNKQTQRLHLKYNGKNYFCQAPEKLKTPWIYDLFYI